MAAKTNGTKSTTKAETKQSEARVTADEQFNDAARVGHEAAAENLKAEAKENQTVAGSENVQFDPKTPDAEPDLKPAGDKMPKEEVLGESKKSQDDEYGVKEGRRTALTNFEEGDEEQGVALGEGKAGEQDPVKEGQETAKANLAAAKKADSTK